MEQTLEQRRNVLNAIPEGELQVINSNLLNNVGDELQTVSQRQPFDVRSITVSEPTQPEIEADSLISQISSLSEGTLGESAFRAEQEKAQGLPELQKTQRDLFTRLKSIQNESLSIPLQLQQESIGRGRTAGGLRPLETAALRNNAIQALTTASLLESSRGNVETALSYVDRAVREKYDPIKERIAVTKNNLDLILNSPRYSLAQKNRASQQKFLQDERLRLIQKQESNEKSKRELTLTAQKYGATSDVIQKMNEAETFEEAQIIAGSFLQDPKAKAELEAMKLDMLLKKAQIAKIEKETKLLGEPTEEEKKENEKKMNEAESSAEIAQQKIDTISALTLHSGLDSRVGTSFLTRTPQGEGFLGTVGKGAASVFKGGLTLGTGTFQDLSDKFSGKGQDFAGGVHQLVQGLTIDKLQEAKETGATFGALSDSELNLLANAATKINDWEVKDKKGVGTGFWNIDEASFKKELETIQNLSRKALLKSQKSLFSEDENSLLDEVYKSSEFNPLNYY